MAGEDRTEAATPRKRSEIRRRGQVARSHDLSSMIVFIGVVVCIHALGGGAASRLQAYMQKSLAGSPEMSLTPRVVFTQGAQAALLLLQTIGPFLLTALLLGLLVNTAQTGFLVSTQALRPDFHRLNPLVGFQRLLSGRGLVETIKALAKLAIIGYIAYATIIGSYPQLLETIRQDIPAVLSFVGELLYRITLRISLFLLVLSAADYGYQRWTFEKSIRMTKEEVKQEFKQHEGNPQMKARIRARMRQMARRRMMEEVAKAAVVITNPTHVAVALKYDAAVMSAPTVVAKGADLLAEKIRELAREHDVPIVENVALARALYKSVDIGREIPGEFYAAVAEVLAFVYRLNARRRYARA
jgi:flagellar biosynthetic protein FlhB